MNIEKRFPSGDGVTITTEMSMEIIMAFCRDKSKHQLVLICNSNRCFLIKVYAAPHLTALLHGECSNYESSQTLLVNFQRSTICNGFYHDITDRLFITDYRLLRIIHGNDALEKPRDDLESLQKEMTAAVSARVAERIEAEYMDSAKALLSSEEGQKFTDKYQQAEYAGMFVRGKIPQSFSSLGNALSSNQTQFMDLSDYAIDEYLTDKKAWVEEQAQKTMESDANISYAVNRLAANLAWQAAYKALLADTSGRHYLCKRILDSIDFDKMKTVNMDLLIDGIAFSFNISTTALHSEKGQYTTYVLPEGKRREYGKLFPLRQSDFYAEDVVRITYSRKTLFEAKIQSNTTRS